MVTQQNALRAAAAAATPLGGAPLILRGTAANPATTLATFSGSTPPPLIAPGDTQGLLYAQYAAAADYAAAAAANYPTSLVSPLLAAATTDYASTGADPSGGLFAR